VQCAIGPCESYFAQYQCGIAQFASESSRSSQVLEFCFPREYISNAMCCSALIRVYKCNVPFIVQYASTSMTFHSTNVIVSILKNQTFNEMKKMIKKQMKTIGYIDFRIDFRIFKWLVRRTSHTNI